MSDDLTRELWKIHEAVALKVKQVWFANSDEVGGSFATGLVLELEDGTMLRHQQDGFIVPFEAVKETLPNNNGSKLAENADVKGLTQ